MTGQEADRPEIECITVSLCIPAAISRPFAWLTPGLEALAVDGSAVGCGCTHPAGGSGSAWVWWMGLALGLRRRTAPAPQVMERVR